MEQNELEDSQAKTSRGFRRRHLPISADLQFKPQPLSTTPLPNVNERP